MMNRDYRRWLGPLVVRRPLRLLLRSSLRSSLLSSLLSSLRSSLRLLLRSSLLYLIPWGVSQAEEPHLEFIRGLRAAGEAELALRYIEQRLPKDLPEPLQRELTLELARVRMDLARDEPELSKRQALYAQARAEFEGFLNARPDDPQAAQVRSELARLVAAQGREAMNRSRRLEGPARAQAIAEARSAYESAAAQLEAAAKQLAAQAEGLAEPKSAAEAARLREWTQSWYTAELEEGTIRFAHALTYAAEAGEIQVRAKLIAAAMDVFKRLAGRDPKHPTCWLARAWLGRCHLENEDYSKAAEQFDAIQAERGIHANDAKRVAAYFRILMVRKQDSDLVKQAGMFQSWLERYRPYINTPEGCGARYFLADTLERIAYDPQRGGVKLDERGRPVSVTAEAASRLKQAERLLRALTEFDNEFTERAAAKRMRLLLAIAIRETPERDPEKVDSFEKCYLLALLEVAELNEDLKNPEFAEDPDRVAEARRQRYQRAARALDRGLTLVKPSDPPREVQDARLLHVYAHLIGGDTAQAATLGENLAKLMTRTGRGAVPALYAVQAHRQLMLAARAENDPNSDAAAQHWQHVQRLVAWMEETWPAEEATDSARHLLGSIHLAEGRPLAALETWERVRPDYPNRFALRGEQGSACFQLQRDPQVPPQTKQQWLDKVIALLESIPRPDPSSEPEAQAAFCQARIQLGYLLLQQGKDYPRVEQLGRDIADSLGTLRVGAKATEIKAQAETLWLYGVYGRVLEHVQARRHDAAAELFLPALDRVKKLPLEDDPSGRLAKAAAELLQLGLRSSIQQGNIERAEEIWQVLSQMDDQDEHSPLVGVLRDVQVQIREMKRHDKQRLAETIDQYTRFLDSLAKKPNLRPEAKILLAQGYSSLDLPAKGLELIRSIPPPANPRDEPPPPAPSGSDDDAAKSMDEEAKAKLESAREAQEAAIRLHRFAQLTEVRLLRQSARLAAKDQEKTQFAADIEKKLDAMIGTPERPGWAFNSLEVRRERIFLLEDLGKYRAAMDAWVAMQKPFAKFSNPPKDDRETRMRAAYYEVRFYMTRLVLMSKQKIADPARRQAEIRKLAEQLVEQERDSRTSDFGGASVRALYQEWLADEPELLKAYVAAGGKVLLPPTSPAQ
ncbi:MAG: hypothetical protein N2039_06185 [Gemmataceae bacterium]|nr:hypothetical protein [Gemmataceae bacterium]